MDAVKDVPKTEVKTVLPVAVTPEVLAAALQILESKKMKASKNPCLCKTCSEPTWIPGGPIRDHKMINPVTGEPYHRNDPEYGTESGEGHFDEKIRKPTRAHHWFCDQCGGGPHSFDEKDLPSGRKQLRADPKDPSTMKSPKVRYYCGACAGFSQGMMDVDGAASVA